MKYLIVFLCVSLGLQAQAVFLKVDATSIDSFAVKGPVRVWKATQLESLTSDTQRIVLQLPDGIQAALYKKKARMEGSRLHWQGRVEGDPFGQAALVQKGSQLTGEISVGGRRFVINQANKQLAVLETILTDDEGPYKNAPTPDLSTLTAVSTPSTDNFIDVMDLYR
jgi:hypothetical protein